MHPGMMMTLLWLAFVISWVLAAKWRRPTEKRAGFGSELPYRITLVVGFVLVFLLPHHRYSPLYTPVLAWMAVAASLAGIAFAWWARLHLGSLWSANITKKTDHRIIDSGPYAIVRHPIYTGLIWMTFCTLFVFHSGVMPLRVAGFVLVVLAYWMKARLEEAWLRNELGAQTYDAYRARVPMLLPFGSVSN
jgi:protein-S-isoprenylcysteine O-methyltransferase Ste14